MALRAVLGLGSWVYPLQGISMKGDSMRGDSVQG